MHWRRLIERFALIAGHQLTRLMPSANIMPAWVPVLQRPRRFEFPFTSTVRMKRHDERCRRQVTSLLRAASGQGSYGANGPPMRESPSLRPIGHGAAQ
jgi:hypothetical protein